MLQTIEFLNVANSKALKNLLELISNNQRKIKNLHLMVSFSKKVVNKICIS